MTHDDALAALTDRLKRENSPYAVATVVRSLNVTPAKPGAKAVIAADGSIEGWIGGGCAQPAVRKAAQAALADGKPRLIRIRPEDGELGGDGMEDFEAHCHSGGTLDVFIEPMLPAPALVVMGASPVGQVLARLAGPIGLRVTAAVPPGDAELFDGVDEIVDGYEIGAAPAGMARFVVVATQGRKDRQALRAAIDSGAGWIALIASRKKTAALKEELLADGAPPDRVARIKGPAGLDIGAVTPEEIAVSILAEIVRDRRAMMKAEGDAAGAPEDEG